jgi:hypothetical protein
MPGSGQPFHYSILVPASPAAAMQTFLTLPSSGNYFDGYEVRQVTGSSLHVTRRHVPTWAIAVAIAGSLFFLIGLVALLVRETEVLIVTVSGQDTTYHSGHPAPHPPGPPTPSLATPPEREENTARSANAYNVKTCPECAETVRAAAKVCRFCNYRFTSESPAP